jgi:tetratricopeptide (TPR) repeat protein
MWNTGELDSNELILPTFFRTLVYKLARFIGRSRPYQLFRTPGGRLLALLLICTIAVLGIAYIFPSIFESTTEDGSSLLSVNSEIAAILGLFVLGFIVSAGIRSRRQVLVGEFKSHIGSDNDAVGKFSQGVSSLLTVELHRLRQLYAEVDDRRAISSIGGRIGPLDYAIMSGDSGGDKFKNIYSSEQIIEIGFIKIPVGAISGLFSKIFAGPQIVGDFHQDGNLIILSVFLSGPKSRSWRVERRVESQAITTIDPGRKDLSAASGDQPIVLTDKTVENLDGMVRELAYRIFTDLTEGGTTKWRATRAFTEGLRDYRSCLLSKKDQLRNLKKAERRFFEAISEDSTYGLARYNLGVVYTELENSTASDEAFLEAIKAWPDGWEPYYALALNRFNTIFKSKKRREKAAGHGKIEEKQYEGSDECSVVDEAVIWNVIHPCNQALALNPDNPQLHTLKGVCYRILALQMRNSGRLSESEEFFREAANAHAFAAKRAWRELWTSQFKANDDTALRTANIQKASSTALWDLARTYYSYMVCGMNNGNVSKFRYPLEPIESVFRQALSIDRANASIYFNLGRIYDIQEEYEDAALSFESATQIEPNNLKYWLFFALASHKAGKWSADRSLAYRNTREFAVGKILEFPSWMQKIPESLKTKIEELPAEGKSLDLRMILDFQKSWYPSQEEMLQCFQELTTDPGSVMKLVENPKSVMKLVESVPPGPYVPAFTALPEEASQSRDAVKGAAFTYHLATALAGLPRHESRATESLIALYQLSKQFLAELDTEWSKWARGIISFELAQYVTCPIDDYKECYSCFKNNCPLEIKKKRIHRELIPLMYRKNEESKALRCASQALHHNPLGFDELYNYGHFLIHTKDLQESLTAFESALLLEPYNCDTLIKLGECYLAMGLNSQKREGKEAFWNRAIGYFEDAREVWRAVEFKHDEKAVKDERANADKKKRDAQLLTILFRLGDLYFALSEYGKAVTTYERAVHLYGGSDDYRADTACCRLKYAEALLHKRDYESCEKYLVDTIHWIQKGTCPSSERETGRIMGSPLPNASFSEEFQKSIMEQMKGVYLGIVSRNILKGTVEYRSQVNVYAGEFFIRAFLLRAYSYAERDAGLDQALKLIQTAERILNIMKGSLEEKPQEDESSEITRSQDKPERGGPTNLSMKNTFFEKVPQFESDILDKRGWVYYKQENLYKAKEYIGAALAIRADADYYFHLANVYAALYRESNKDPILGRWALAFCEHALIMTPRPGLVDQVNQLRKPLENEMGISPT